MGGVIDSLLLLNVLSLFLCPPLYENRKKDYSMNGPGSCLYLS